MPTDLVSHCLEKRNDESEMQRRDGLKGMIMCTEEIFKIILKELPKLTDAQKDKLRPRLKVLGLSGGGEEKSAEKSDEEWVRRGIGKALREKGIITTKYIGEATASRAYKGYAEKTRAAAEALERGSAKKLNYDEKVLLAQLATESMCKRFQGGISLRRILMCADQLPAYFDEAFPGYLANRMVMMVLTMGKSNGRRPANH